MGKYKRIADAFGKTKHWVRNDDDFTYNYCEYEKDVYTGRCYKLEASTSLKSEMDGALVRRRIGKAVYENCLSEAKKVCS